MTSGASYHEVDGFGSVFIVAGPHGIFEEAVIIVFVLQDAYAALSQEGIAFFQVSFCYHQDIHVIGKVEGGETSGYTGADDDDIVFVFHDS